MLHADMRIFKDVKTITGAESVEIDARESAVFEYKPVQGDSTNIPYNLSLYLHDEYKRETENVNFDAIIEVYNSAMTELKGRSVYTPGEFPEININLDHRTKYYIIVRGYATQSVKAELSVARDSYAATIEYHFDEAYSAKYRSVVDACGKTHYPGVKCTCNDSNDFIEDAIGKEFEGSNTKTVGLWSGNPVFCFGDENRSFSNGVYIVMTEQNISENDILGVFIHELAHQYKVQDHYHDAEGNEKCVNKEICSTCGENPRFANCIMNEPHQTNVGNMSGNDLFCTECKNELLRHLNNHH